MLNSVQHSGRMREILLALVARGAPGRHTAAAVRLFCTELAPNSVQKSLTAEIRRERHPRLGVREERVAQDIGEILQLTHERILQLLGEGRLECGNGEPQVRPVGAARGDRDGDAHDA